MNTIALVIVADRVGILGLVLPGLVPHFDRSVALVDDRADPGVRRAIGRAGVEAMPYRWQGSFSAAANAVAGLACTDWVFQLDCDEYLTGADRVRAAADAADRDGIRLAWVPRRHWLDMERTRELDRFWPDPQCRLRRHDCLLRYRAHPVPLERTAPPPDPGAFPPGVVIEHFNFALRDDSAWHAANTYYRGQVVEDVRDEDRPVPPEWLEGPPA